MPRNYPRLLLISLLVMAAPLIFAATESRRAFDLPAAAAEKTLKLFSEQSGRALIMGAAEVGATPTKAVRGDFTAPEALARMLAGTGLIATQDEKSGAFVVHPEKPDPNAPRAAPAPASVRPPNGPVPVPASAPIDEVIRISPFEVTAESTRGFYASNTLSGTRLNSKLEDLGSSITVVTKQQMEDFGLKDINDIFLYEANTEGTGNFTDFSVDRNGFVVDNTTGGLGGGNALGGTTGANRIRGIKQANVALGNFATSGRVPVDTFTVESVEISRGPNSSIFGLGNASGTLNILPVRANMQVRKTKVEVRADSFDGTRVAFDHNQPLLAGKLAIRGIAITQDNRFERKPSVDHSTRYDGMITYRPFRTTTLRASYERYANFSRLPNSVTPRDGIGYWLESGRPTWDPITSTVHRGGRSTVVPYNGTAAIEAAQLGPGLSSDSNVYTRSNLYVNGDGAIGLWSVGRLSNAATPASVAGNVRLIQSATYPRSGLDATTRSLTARSLYDWSSVNLLAANWSRQANSNATVELEQFFLHTPRHLLALQAGWYQEDSTLYRWDSIGQSSESPLTVSIDVNERLLDGTANPYFLRPYVGAAQPTNFYQPFRRNIYRGQMAYQLKLGGERSALRWLGDHSLSGYYEYNRTFTGGYSYRDAILSNHAWLPAGTDRSNGTNAARIYSRYYLGDSAGNNIDFGTRNWFDGYGPGTYRWFNGATGQWVNETATLGASYRSGSANKSDRNRTQTLIKTLGGTWQGHFLGDRVVSTLGVREDSSYSRNGTNYLAADGYSLAMSNQSEWPGAWELRSGRTTTMGVVVKPLRGIRTLAAVAGQAGPKGLAAQLLQSLNLHYNESDSFQPEALRQDLFTNLLPDPTGKGKDYGFSFNFLNDQLVVRYNQYDTLQLNSRESQNGTIASRTARVEINYNGNNDPLNLYGLGSTWVDRLQPGLTGAAREAAIAKYTGLPPDRPGRLSLYTIGATSDVIAKGREIEVNYNPSRFWTMKLTVAQQKSIDSGISQELMAYLADRLPFWTSLIDPIRGTPWYTTDYGGSRPTPKAFLAVLVFDPIKLAQANEGKTRTQVREWRSNFMTSYRLAGITEHKWLKKLAVTGAIRWEDKANIGYYADAGDPTIYDANRPIFSKGNTYVDLGATYRTRLFSDKIQLRVQFNVRNAFEGGRLQAIGALPDGSPHTFRIVDPRLFMLTASFEL